MKLYPYSPFHNQCYIVGFYRRPLIPVTDIKSQGVGFIKSLLEAGALRVGARSWYGTLSMYLQGRLGCRGVGAIGAHMEPCPLKAGGQERVDG